MSDDSTLIGKGSEILLPKSGNPFKKSAGSEEPPRDLTPAEVAARFGKAAPEAESSASSASTTGDLPADLSPADVAALFPSTQDERNAIPVAVPEEPASAYTPPPPPRQSAANTDDSLAAFDPDASIEDAPLPGRADLPPTPIDIGTFNPDAPVGTDAGTEIFIPVDASMADATSIKADAPVAEPLPIPAGNVSIGVVMPEVSSTPSAAEPTPSIGLHAEAAPPPTESAESEPTPAAPAPTIKIGGGIVNVGGLDAAPRSSSHEALPDSIGLESPDSSKDLPTVPNSSLDLPLKEDTRLLKLFVTEERMQALWKRIEDTEQRVIKDMSSLRYQRTANLEKVRTARNVLLAGREYYEDALRYVAEVEADLLYIQRVRGWSFRYGTALTAYNLVWIGVIVYSALALSAFVSTAYANTPFENYGLAIWVSMLAGAMGGVTKSLVSLVAHITKQDFDSQFTIWYVSSPFAGVILGIFVWMFAQVGLAGVMGAVGAGATGTTVLGANNLAGVILYAALAWLVGFQQNLVFKLVDRLKKALLNEEEEKETA